MENRKVALISYAHDNTGKNRFYDMMNKLTIPDSIDIEVFFIECAGNAAAAFNQGMNAAKDIKIKIYLEDGVEILTPDLIADALDYFDNNPNISMIGVTGTDQAHSDGVSYAGVHRINRLLLSDNRVLEDDNNGKYTPCLLDGGVYITNVDIPWRDDLFRSGYFLGASESIEYKRQGYAIDILKLKKDYIRNNNDLYDIPVNDRQSFLKEYSRDALPLVSVVIPSSRPRFLKKSLPSVLNQNYRNIEIFISDDSESDEGEKYVKDVMKNDSRIIYERHPGFGIEENYEACLSYNNSKAEFVNWLMDDDIFLQGKVSTMVDAFLDNPDVTLVSSVRNAIDENGRIIGKMGLTNLTHPVKVSSESASESLLDLDNYIGEPTTALIRKSAMLDGYKLGYEGMNPYVMSIYPDGSTWLKVLEKGDLLYLDEPYSCFRQYKDHASENLSLLLVLLYGQGDAILHYANKGIFLQDKRKICIASTIYLERVGGFLKKAFEQGADSKSIIQLLKQITEIDVLMNNSVHSMTGEKL